MKLKLLAMGVLFHFGMVAHANPPTGGQVKLKVTIQNLTAGNVLSPPLVVVQEKGFSVFEVGKAATPGIAEVAETGSVKTLESELSDCRGLLAKAQVAGTPLLPGTSRSLVISVPAQELKRGATLNVIAMIGKSNDSFISTKGIGLNQLMADGQVHYSFSIPATNYDAGSEQNTGNVEDFGPSGHPTEELEGIISLDRGLNPRGNAPDIMAWGSVAAEITVQRLN